MYKSLKITDIFIPKGGNGTYTSDFCNNNQGDYPVFSSNNETYFSKINKFDYDGNYLTWSIVGCAGYITEHSGKFSITNNRGILIPKIDTQTISLTYLKYKLEPLFRNNKKGRLGINGKNEYTTLNATAIKNIKDTIEIPICTDGTFDIKAQKELALKYQEIEKQKQILIDKIEYLKKTKIDMTNNLSHFTYVEFNKMFKLERGTIISKAFIASNKGHNPVYSTQKDIFGYVNSYMKEGKYLLWNTDGLAGYIKITNGKFSYTNIVGIMIPTNYYDMSLISLDYLKNYLEPVFRKNRKGRFGINGKNEYTKINSTMIKNLNIKIPIPITDNGDYDIEKQREIAQKIAAIESIKSDLYNKVIELTNIKINLY